MKNEGLGLNSQFRRMAEVKWAVLWMSSVGGVNLMKLTGFLHRDPDRRISKKIS
jgi:hypothetical protein